MKTSRLSIFYKSRAMSFLMTLALFLFSFGLKAQMINCPTDATLECGDSTDPANTGMATTTGDCAPTPVAWINELHYDNGNPGNGGADVGEFIEIAGTAGFDLSTCEIYFYNGSNGNLYGGSGGFRTLSGTIDDEGMGYGAVSFDITALAISSIQNGNPDGLALVCGGQVLQFISYEGTFVAAGNMSYPAFGMTSTDIGVFEDGTTPIGFSLQLNGMGSTYDQFTWIAPTAESPGSLNTGQSIAPPPPPAISFSDTGGPEAMGCGQYQYSITRSWSATFSCGTVLTCDQMIEVEDNTAPTITCPANVVLACDESTDPMDTGEATAVDNCMAPIVPAVWINEIHYDNTGADVNEFVEVAGTAGFDLSTCAIYLYNGTSTNLYNSNPPFALSGTIDDEGMGYGAVSIPVPNIQNGVNSNGTEADGVALVCNGVVIQFLTYEGVITAGNGPAAGMTSVDIGVLEDGSNPVGTSLQLTGMGNQYADFSWTEPSAESPGSLNSAQTISLAANDVVITSSDVSTQGMGCSEFSYVIIRTWTATDACGNATNCEQIITVEDNSAPTIACPDDVTVECDQPTDPGATGMATATGDNCAADDQLTIVFSDVSAQTPMDCGNDSYTITRTWTATDPCGNATNCIQVITVEDTTPPTIVCPANVSIECDEDTAPANTGIAVAVDDCAPEAEIVITFADVTTQTAGGCGQYQYLITRTWTATDPCGNATNCVQTITVEDTTPPAIVCPADVSLSCTDSTDSGDTGVATSTDNCSAVGEVVITSSDISTEGGEGCSQFTFTILRTWIATDACGNTTTCVQTIAIADTEPPIITCPPNQTLTCFETVPAPLMTAADFISAGGTISDNCTTVLTDFTVLSQNNDNGGNNCPDNGRTVVRTYFIQDACGNTSSCTQTFTYLESTQGPVITSILPSCFKYCSSLANPMETDITYDTDCSFGATVNITGPSQIGADNCPGTIYRYTYTVTDDCGRTSLPVTRDFIIGNDGPTIECAPFNLLLECGDPNNSDYIASHIAIATANSSCELGVTINHFPQNFNNITCNSSTVVTFVATDDCGRTATCSTTINISDNTAPEITSTYVDGVCNEAVCGSDVNFWFNEWKAKVLEGLTGTDACDANVSFTASGPNSPLQNCPDGTAETVITFVASDNCGNTSGIDYSFYVVPADEPAPAPSISGLVATEELEAVADVMVTLEGSSNNIVVQTESEGLYAFSNLLEGANYAVTPYSNVDPLNGVSSYDLVLISKHILQLQLLDSPYKMIAADINNSGSITTLDLVELRKLILHVDDDFANNTSWRFIEADYVFPEANNPFATVFPEATFINGLAADIQQDFVGVKIGDVNGSVVANDFAGVADRTTVSDLSFNVKDQRLVAGDRYDVAFEAGNFEGIHGYQFTLNFDETVLEFNTINAGELQNLTESNFGVSMLEKGVITASWSNQEAITLNRDAAVFTVSFTAKEDGMLSEAINLGSKFTKAEAYNADLALMDVKLRFDNIENITSGFRLYQNKPNPFVGETNIGFELPEAMSATLTIYDMTGRVLKQLDNIFAKGYNEIVIDRADFGTGSLFYYRLVADGFEESRKMVMIE